MKDITSISKMMKTLEKDCEPCTRCGMCQVHCPVFSTTGRETDVARGKVALIDGLREEMVTDAKGVYDRLSKCLLCGSCVEKCPRGVKTNELILKARTILTAYLGLPAYKKILFRNIISNPRRFDKAVSLLSKYQDIFLEKKNPFTGVSCARYSPPFLLERHIRPISKVPFHKRVPHLDIPEKRHPAALYRVFFFTGCLIDNLFPEVAEAAVASLSHHGMQVVIPENQLCCGIPMVSEGDNKAFKDTVLQTLRLFPLKKEDILVTACATCTYTIRKIWPLMFSDHPSEKVKENIRFISERAMDISQVIYPEIKSRLNKQKKNTGAVPITYHSPCHLSKSLGIHSEPLSLISHNPDYRLITMEGSDTCCGLGGSFNLKHYDISVEIGMKKRDNIVSSGAEMVATSCPACMMQLSDMLSKKGDRIAVRHAIEIYAETILKESK